MTTITCKIPDKLNAAMTAMAQKKGVSKSQIVRESIEMNVEVTASQAQISAFDMMKFGCGILKKGPKDLATNPNHLKGFGRD